MNNALLVFEVTLLVGLSAVCSGLNIALMSLEVADLRRKSKLGNIQAKRILPLRKNSHLSLAAILLTNVAVVSATTLVLESRFRGLVAGIMSTMLIVVFGEVVPQAWFGRYALRVTSLLIPLLKFMIVITYPISKPLQLMLDNLFGHEAAQLHSRRELGIIIGEHIGQPTSELDDDEVEIIKSALMLSEKRVREIMTPMRKVFWLTPDTIIDGAKIDLIKERRWSRIPIFDQELTKPYGVLLMKDLVDIDFDEKPIRVDQFMLHPTKIIGSMTALDTTFRKFIGAHTHLMPVERDGKIVGIITIEDVIEEILGHEIEDEADNVGHR